MSLLAKFVKFTCALAMITFSVFTSIGKLFLTLFEEDSTETQISFPGMQMGETTLGTVEPVIINDDDIVAGALSDEPIVRNL